jgi:hypothetical protein
MTTVFIISLFTYFGIGLIIYAFTDTRKIASILENKLKVVTYGDVQHYLFFGVVGLWPLWLVIKNQIKE